MTYFIEKDNKWYTRDLTWTKYHTEAESFSTPERAHEWAKALNLSGYIITEHDFDNKKVKFKKNYGLLSNN